MHPLPSLLLLLLLPFSLFAQALTYDAPLGGPLLVTGTFGELRSDHFHAGIDFRAPVNTPIFAVADGFVSRILVSPGGFGQAVYIDHPDGHRSVYGHLETLAPALKDTIRKRQFAAEEFRQDLRFDSLAFPVRRGEQIGGSGNRGHSFGPHLHFEMRTIDGDAPVNPQAFGFAIPDTRRPQIRNLRVYELDGHGLETDVQTIKVEEQKDGTYTSVDTVYVTAQRIGLALKAYDRQNAMPNWNGIYAGELYADTTLVYDFYFDRIPFGQTEYLNAMTDYREWVENTSWYHRFWALPNQHFRARPQDAKKVDEARKYNGVLKLQAGTPLPVKLNVRDHTGNVSTLNFVLLYRPGTATAPARPHEYFLPAGEPSIIENGALRLELAADALYRDCFFRYARLPDTSTGHLSDVFQLDDHFTPLHGNARLHLRPAARIPDSLRHHVFLGSCAANGKWISHGGKWDADGVRFAADIPTFGDYALFLDTIPPVVEINAFSADLRRAAGFSVLVTDNVAGGGIDFRGTIDGKWVLLEYDSKDDKLTYSFNDGDPGPGQHRFDLEISDGRGNTTTWTRNFRR